MGENPVKIQANFKLCFMSRSMCSMCGAKEPALLEEPLKTTANLNSKSIDFLIQDYDISGNIKIDDNYFPLSIKIDYSIDESFQINLKYLDKNIFHFNKYSSGPSNDLTFRVVFNSLISELFIILILSADFLS